MSREFPDWISPARAADGKRVFNGTIALLRFKRLVPLLVEAQGEATFTAAFSRDLDRRVCIDLQTEAALSLLCQASLEVYQEQVQRRSTLVVIESDRELDELSDHCDVVKAEHGRIAIADIVEDELLLGLPQIPRQPGLRKIDYSTNPGNDPENDTGSRAEGQQNPFADLQDLLGRKHHD